MREREETDRQYRGKMEQEWQSRHRVGETAGGRPKGRDI
jgi:hypothetical protein